MTREDAKLWLLDTAFSLSLVLPFFQDQRDLPAWVQHPIGLCLTDNIIEADYSSYALYTL